MAAKPEPLSLPPPERSRGEPLGPAFYAAGRPSLWRDVRALLHPPYTAWHLSYVVIGGVLVSRVNWSTLGATVLAFFLAVGIGAHVLDELHGRPLSTSVPSSVLVGLAATSLAGAAALGLLGIERVGGWLGVFIAAGLVLVLAYNLELVGGHLHNDLVFALAWGAFPVLVSAFAQSRSISWAALLVAAGAALLSACQRALSTPARRFRRQVTEVSGTIELADGTLEQVDALSLVAPLERALRFLSFGVVAVALGLVVMRLGG